MADEALELLSAFAVKARRGEAARNAAVWLGADALLLFVVDPELGVLLPAPGLPQTTLGGPSWRAFLRASSAAGTHRSEVDYPPGCLVPALARVEPGGLALVLVGGAPDERRLEELARGMPLLGRMFETEHAQRIAEGEAAVARDIGSHARHLAAALDNARADLERTLAEAARLNAELKENDRRKDEFLAMLGHELRNPIAAIAGALEVVRLDTADRAKGERAWAIIDRQAAQLARLVDDLLDVSRVSQGKITLRPSVVSVEAAIERAVEAARPLIDERRHSVEIDAEPGLHVTADPARLEQMVTNLLTNAAKYTNPGGRIRVSAAREGDDAVIIVEDNGIGIAPAMLAQVFDAFVQVAPSIDRSAGGLGVGLTLVKRLAELHGGRVVATSEPGRGSAFALRFRAAEAPPRADEREAPSRVASAKKKRVLIVDDNIDSGEMLVELTRSWGHSAVHASDGPSALDAAAALRPDIVLLDIGLPGMDGYEVAARLRSSATSRDARIVALSGYGQEDDRRKSHAAGCDDHLVKPVDFKTLAAVIEAS